MHTLVQRVEMRHRMRKVMVRLGSETREQGWTWDAITASGLKAGSRIDCKVKVSIGLWRWQTEISLGLELHGND